MKKILTLAVVAAAAFALTSCGGNANTKKAAAEAETAVTKTEACCEQADSCAAACETAAQPAEAQPAAQTK